MDALYTSCKHSLVLLKMGEIIARNVSSWLRIINKSLLSHLVGCLYYLFQHLWWVHYTTNCKHSLVLLKMGEIIARNVSKWLRIINKSLLLHLVGCLYYLFQWYMFKHVQLIGIINKPLLLHLVGCLYNYYQWFTVNQISKPMLFFDNSQFIVIYSVTYVWFFF
jgi:hypothetical protein